MTIAQTLSIFYYQQKKYKKAASKIKIVLRYDPTHLLMHQMLNDINQQLKDRDIYDYQKTLIEEFKIPIDLAEMPHTSFEIKNSYQGLTKP